MPSRGRIPSKPQLLKEIKLFIHQNEAFPLRLSDRKGTAWHIRSNPTHAKRVLGETMSTIDEAYPDIAPQILDCFNTRNGATSQTQRSQPSRATVQHAARAMEVEEEETDLDWEEEDGRGSRDTTRCHR